MLLLLCYVDVTLELSEFQACASSDECPAHAQCFRDDCARCECPAGHSVTNYILGDTVKTVCIAGEL